MSPGASAVAAAVLADTLSALSLLPMRYRVLFGDDTLSVPASFQRQPLTRGAAGGLQEAFETLFALGAQAAIVVRDDVPTLPMAEVFDGALWLAEGQRISIGQLENGGIYTIGLARAEPTLFDHRREVDSASDLAARARELGLEPQLLPETFAVRDAASFKRLGLEPAANTAVASKALLADPDFMRSLG